MKLSVITIAYNNLNGLKKTLALFGEAFAPDLVEVVVVDGNSDDGSKAFLESQSISRVWVSEPDKGIYNAMNKGLAMASGDYVWFLNSGDYVESRETIEAILEALKANPDAVYGETMMVDADGRHLGTRSEISTRRLPEKLTWKSFRYGMNVGHQSFIIKRRLAKPYNESYRYVADIDWMIASLKDCRQVVNLGRVIACFSVDGFSSVQRSKSNQERYRVLRLHYGFVPNLLAHLYIVLRKICARKRL